MASIYHLSWSETSFLAKLWLFLKSHIEQFPNIWSASPNTEAAGYSALSSTCYSIAGTAGARLNQLKSGAQPKWLRLARIASWCCTWLPLAAWCYWRMLPLSDRVVDLIGYDGMSADQCDIRQSILWQRGFHEEAEECILIGLAKNPEKAHTRGLLRVRLAMIYRHEGRPGALEAVRLALDAAFEAEKQDSRQAARIYRHCADLLAKSAPTLARELNIKARTLAEKTGARDQLLKGGELA